MGQDQPGLKLVNSLVLLVLNYANASVSLPEAIANPDADFLAVILTIAGALCYRLLVGLVDRPAAAR